jgi:hypothetical protein
MYITWLFYQTFWYSLVNSESDKEGGLYKPDINHFLLFILISIHIDSIVWYSKFIFLSQARSDSILPSVCYTISYFYPENTYLFVCGVTVDGVTIKIV